MPKPKSIDELRVPFTILRLRSGDAERDDWRDDDDRYMAVGEGMAKVTASPASEQLIADGQTTIKVWEIWTRYREDITKSDQLRIRGVVFALRDVENVELANDWLKIMAVQRGRERV